MAASSGGRDPAPPLRNYARRDGWSGSSLLHRRPLCRPVLRPIVPFAILGSIFPVIASASKRTGCVCVSGTTGGVNLDRVSDCAPELSGHTASTHITNPVSQRRHAPTRPCSPGSFPMNGRGRFSTAGLGLNSPTRSNVAESRQLWKVVNSTSSNPRNYGR